MQRPAEWRNSKLSLISDCFFVFHRLLKFLPAVLIGPFLKITQRFCRSPICSNLHLPDWAFKKCCENQPSVSEKIKDLPKNNYFKKLLSFIMATIPFFLASIPGMIKPVEHLTYWNYEKRFSHIPFSSSLKVWFTLNLGPTWIRIEIFLGLWPFQLGILSFDLVVPCLFQRLVAVWKYFEVK